MLEAVVVETVVLVIRDVVVDIVKGVDVVDVSDVDVADVVAAVDVVEGVDIEVVTTVDVEGVDSTDVMDVVDNVECPDVVNDMERSDDVDFGISEAVVAAFVFVTLGWRGKAALTVGPLDGTPAAANERNRIASTTGVAFVKDYRQL